MNEVQHGRRNSIHSSQHTFTQSRDSDLKSKIDFPLPRERPGFQCVTGNKYKISLKPAKQKKEGTVLSVHLFDLLNCNLSRINKVLSSFPSFLEDLHQFSSPLYTTNTNEEQLKTNQYLLFIIRYKPVQYNLLQRVMHLCMQQTPVFPSQSRSRKAKVFVWSVNWRLQITAECNWRYSRYKMAVPWETRPNTLVPALPDFPTVIKLAPKIILSDHNETKKWR